MIGCAVFLTQSQRDQELLPRVKLASRLEGQKHISLLASWGFQISWNSSGIWISVLSHQQLHYPVWVTLCYPSDSELFSGRTVEAEWWVLPFIHPCPHSAQHPWGQHLRNCWLTHGCYWKAFIEYRSWILSCDLNFFFLFFFSFNWLFSALFYWTWLCVLAFGLVNGNILGVTSFCHVFFFFSACFQADLCHYRHPPLPLNLIFFPSCMSPSFQPCFLPSFSLIFHDVCSLNLFLSPLLGCLQTVKPSKPRSV